MNGSTTELRVVGSDQDEATATETPQSSSAVVAAADSAPQEPSDSKAWGSITFDGQIRRHASDTRTTPTATAGDMPVELMDDLFKVLEPDGVMNRSIVTLRAQPDPANPRIMFVLMWPLGDAFQVNVLGTKFVRLFDDNAPAVAGTLVCVATDPITKSYLNLDESQFQMLVAIAVETPLEPIVRGPQPGRRNAAATSAD